jgi:hypothetical protein
MNRTRLKRAIREVRRLRIYFDQNGIDIEWLFLFIRDVVFIFGNNNAMSYSRLLYEAGLGDRDPNRYNQEVVERQSKLESAQEMNIDDE